MACPGWSWYETGVRDLFSDIKFVSNQPGSDGDDDPLTTISDVGCRGGSLRCLSLGRPSNSRFTAGLTQRLSVPLKPGVK